MENEAPEYKFFWKKYEVRAVSKLSHKYGDFDKMSLLVNKIEVDKSIENPLHLCSSCGSHLPRPSCDSCYDFMAMHNEGKVYFTVDHFNGDDYAVVFFVKSEQKDQSSENPKI